MDFQKNRSHTIPPDLPNELEAPADEEYSLKHEQNLKDLDAGLLLPERALASNLVGVQTGSTLTRSLTPPKFSLTALEPVSQQIFVVAPLPERRHGLRWLIALRPLRNFVTSNA